MELLDAITQRKTIKLFQRGVSIPRETLSEMLALAQLAPSKANLQPWRFVIVDEAEQKNQLTDIVAFNGPPCESASAVIIVLADLQYDRLFEAIIDTSIEQGCLHQGFKQPGLNFMNQMHSALNAQEIREQVCIDTSLAAMQLMLIAKDKGYDTHAIGIFDKTAVMQRFAIDSERYVPVMLIAIGKAAVPPIPSARLVLDYTVSWNNGSGFKA